MRRIFERLAVEEHRIVQAFPQSLLFVFRRTLLRKLMFGKRDPRLLRKIFDCLRKIHTLDLLVKAKNIASALAGKAIGNTFLRRNEQTRVAIVMERTKTHKIPSLLLYLAIFADKRFDWQPRFDFGDWVHGEQSIPPARFFMSRLLSIP